MSLLTPHIEQGLVVLSNWVSRPGGEQSVVEPATGNVLGTVGLSTPECVRRAATDASEAQKGWAAKAPSERADVLRRAGDLFLRHGKEIQRWLIREAGSIPSKANLETHTASRECYEAASLPTHPLGHILASDNAHWSMSRRRPVGVVSVIAPFNFPLILSIRSVAPALALGNSVLLKPDPRTSISGGVVLARIFEEAGLPAGVLSVVLGGAAVGEAVVTAPEVRVISFTGSTNAGRTVGAVGAQHLKRVHLELGGNNALVVLPGADLALAVSAGAFGSFLHQGQICMATGRHLIHESLYDDYVEALAAKAATLPVGNPATEQVALGPIIDASQRDRIHELVQRTTASGARLVAGGTYQDLFYRPTVLADVTTEMPAYAEEVFGPVAPVVAFSTVGEAIRLAGATEYGLSLGILGDVGIAMQIADAVPSGIVHINEQTVGDEANAPMGGIGASGTGSRFGGAESNIEAFTEVQWLTARSTIASYPF